MIKKYIQERKTFSYSANGFENIKRNVINLIVHIKFISSSEIGTPNRFCFIKQFMAQYQSFTPPHMNLNGDPSVSGKVNIEGGLIRSGIRNLPPEQRWQQFTYNSNTFFPS